MSEYIIQGETLTAIGDAIRAKTGGTETLTPEGMVSAIEGLEVGGGFPNGTEWTQSNITSGEYATSYGNGLFVAVTVGYTKGPILYSTNGITWHDSNITSVYSCSKAVYANGVWVVALNTGGILYSLDGMWWEQSTVESGWFDSVLNANGIWVAVSSYGSAKGIHYSTDGQTWIQCSTSSCNGVSYGNGVWIATGADGQFMRSTDGITWQNISSGFEVDFGVMYANGIWVAGDIEKGAIHYSTDGETWSASNIVFDTGRCNCISNGNGVWVAELSNHGLYYSNDGREWFECTIESYAFDYSHIGTSRIDYANGIWIYASQISYYSIDGITWTAIDAQSCGIDLLSANGIWIIGTTAGIYYSQTWAP